MAVLLMFTVAFIAAQARANLPAEVSASSEFASGNRTSIILDEDSLRHIQSIPYAVETMLALPIDIELNIGELTLRSGNSEAAGSDDSSAQ